MIKKISKSCTITTKMLSLYNMIITNLIIIFLLLFANGFFVASEFALVSVRQTRISQLANEGNNTAKITVKALKELDKYIAATQLGITIASIGLGWVGEATLAAIIHPLFDFLPGISGNIATHSIAVAVSFALITFMHVVLGELMPKSIALQYPEKTTLIVTRPLVFTAKVFTPFIYLLNGFGNMLLKLMKIPPAHPASAVHTEEELDMIIDASYKGGVLNETESLLLKNSLKFTDLMAKQIMVPRCGVISVPVEIDIPELENLILENQYTRYPVYEGNFDNIVGVLHVKDLYSYLIRHKKIELRNILRKPLFVPETMSADVLLDSYKKNKTEIAIVVDEFGGMSGIISLEDVLEEICGEVQDEFDEEENDFKIKEISENEFVVNGLFRVEDFFKYFDIEHEEDDVDTVGGLVQRVLGRIPCAGDETDIEGLHIKVAELKGRRVSKLIVKRVNPVQS